MDNEETECFDVSFVKARAKNIVESNILCKQLRSIDRQCRRSISRIESELREERRFDRRLKREAKEFRNKDKLRQDKADEKIVAMEKHRRTALGKSRKTVWDVGDTLNKDMNENVNDEDMSVSGQGMAKEVLVEPKMFFWSQDSSTKLPVMSSFYGYRLNLQRSMTEVKLLGQQMYPEVKREIQSADTVFARSTSNLDLRRVKTSGQRGSIFDEDFCYEALKRAPPPSRENTNVTNTSEVRTASEMQTRENTYFEVPNVKTRENTFSSELKRHEKPGYEPNLKEVEKITRQESNVRKTPRIESRSSAFPKVQETHIEKSSPENINLDLKHAGSSEQLPQLSQRTAGTAMGCVRPRRKKAIVLSIKTREEATKQFQEVIMKKPSEKPKVLTELEQSYSNIPSLMNEINKLQTTIEFLPTPKNGQYSKSAFGLSMQSAISKKVLNRTTLPVAFRKNNNTMLKHYGTPFMEVRATTILNADRALTAE